MPLGERVLTFLVRVSPGGTCTLEGKVPLLVTFTPLGIIHSPSTEATVVGETVISCLCLYVFLLSVQNCGFGIKPLLEQQHVFVKILLL